MSFVGLHIHSDYSLLDGASQISQMIDRFNGSWGDVWRDRQTKLSIIGNKILIISLSKL
ncbi:MAG: hypothetical protein AB4368_05025 [Xenococcaceae cyanobacterium]